MFGKLLKHDFIATGRIMGIVYAVMAGISAYILGSFYLGDTSVEDGKLLPSLSLILLMLLAVVNVILTIVVVMTNFQKSLYGDQGYLSFTLPVKSFSLFSAKVLVSVFWYVAAAVAWIAAGMVFVGAVEKDLGEDGMGLVEMILGMTQEGLSIEVLLVYVTSILITCFFAICVLTMIAFFSITVSNTRPFQKHYVLFTMLFLAVSSIAVLKIAEFAVENIHLGFNYSFTTGKLSFATGTQALVSLAHIDMVAPITMMLISVGLFVGTYMIMKKKVNIR